MSAPSSSRWRRVYNGVILSALESPRSSNFLKDVMMPAVALLTEFLQLLAFVMGDIIQLSSQESKSWGYAHIRLESLESSMTMILQLVVVGRAFFKGYPRCNAAAVALLNTMVTYTTLFFYIPILRAFIPLYLCKYENSTIADAAGGYCWVPATDGFSPTVLFSSFTSFVMICLYVPIALITALNVFVEDSESGFLLRSHNARVDFIMLVCKTVLSITISVLMPMKVEFDPSSRRMERAILSLLFFAICALLSYALRATQPYFVKSVNALRFASWCGVSYAALIGAIVVGMGYDDRESIRSMVYGGVAVVVFLAYFMCTPSAVSAYVDSVLEHFFREYGK